MRASVHRNYLVTNVNFEEWIEACPDLKDKFVKFFATADEAQIRKKSQRGKKYYGGLYENFRSFLHAGTSTMSYNKLELNITISIRRIHHK